MSTTIQHRIFATPAHSILTLEHALSKKIDNEPEGPRSNVGVES